MLCAVEGSICMRPRAPDDETLQALKSLSCLMTARMSASGIW
jgi:hypothetical protein